MDADYLLSLLSEVDEKILSLTDKVSNFTEFYTQGCELLGDDVVPSDLNKAQFFSLYGVDPSGLSVHLKDFDSLSDARYVYLLLNIRQKVLG